MALNIKVNFITVLIVILIVIGSQRGDVSTLWILPVAIIYILLTVAGSYFICMNYYFKSFCKGKTSEKVVAITFDDGPHNVNTLKILNVLKQKNAVAVFFVTGKNAVENPEILKSISEAGHIIGNHSYSHSGMFDLFSSSKMKEEISLTNSEIERITGKSPLLFRPPFGVTNPMLKKAFSAVQMYSIGWSLRSLDTVLEKEKLILKLKSNTRTGDIVLFHDTTNDIEEILEIYIQWLLDNGFKIIDLSTLLNIEAYENQS